MNIKISVVLLLASCLQLYAVGQEKQYTDTGYLINKSWSQSVLIAFFLPSKMALSGTKDIKSIVYALAADKKIGFSFFAMPDSIQSMLTSEFAKKTIKIRYESQVLFMRGFYDSSMLKYKDEFFHISLIPAIITYKTFTGFSSPLSSGHLKTIMKSRVLAAL